MELTIKNLNVDELKGRPNLKHKFVFVRDWNDAENDKDKVFVECRYLRAGEIQDYIRTVQGGDGSEPSTSFDMRMIFKRTVLAIRNFKVNGKDIVDPAEFLNLPAVKIVDEMISEYFSHIVTGEGLTEDEEKNSGSGTKHSA